jgi:hypothetical protein
MLRNRWICAFTMASLGLTVLGCGSKYDTLSVHGTLTCDGQPVPDMVVRFAPANGRASEGKTAADGSFDLFYAMDQPGVERGNHRVMVDWAPLTDDAGVKPAPLAKKVLDDFKKNGPIAAIVEEAQSNFEIKLPR